MATPTGAPPRRPGDGQTQPQQPSVDRRAAMLRMRSDSNGSTRGAFGPMPGPAKKKADQQSQQKQQPAKKEKTLETLENGDPAAAAAAASPPGAPAPAKRRKVRGKAHGKVKGQGKHPKTKEEKQLPPGEINLADAASMAVELELGADTFAHLGFAGSKGGSSASAAFRSGATASESAPAPQPPGGSGRAKAALNHTPLPPHPFAATDKDGGMPFYQRHLSNIPSQDEAEADNLQLSPPRNMPPRLTQGLGMGNFDSMQYSDSTIRTTLNPSDRLNSSMNRSGLIGSAIVDDSETGKNLAQRSVPAASYQQNAAMNAQQPRPSPGARPSGPPSAQSQSTYKPSTQQRQPPGQYLALPAPEHNDRDVMTRQEIASFSALVHGSAMDYGTSRVSASPASPRFKPVYATDGENYQAQPQLHFPLPSPAEARNTRALQEYSREPLIRIHEEASDKHLEMDANKGFQYSASTISHPEFRERVLSYVSLRDRLWFYLNPRNLLGPEAMYDDDGNLYHEEPLGMLATFLRWLFFDPDNPEFTSLQQFSWAVMTGIIMGVLTAKWGDLIEFCVDFMWKEVPETLLEWGVFTDLDGSFPLPHYMWICPAIFGGLLSYISVVLPKPIPDQNEWIKTLHTRGVMSFDTFWNLIAISTAGMASGLSLGPELPLVLASGMVGSYFGVLTQQSILSARVLNLTAASAAIGGFFGFPMAGALFVLELPHRMGLQYFEALSPATIASIVAVLVNRMVTGNDVKGYFNYPFLTATLPSKIFYVAVMYGIVGSIVGAVYAEGVKKIKTITHDLFHHHGDHDHHGEHKEEEDHHATIEIPMGNGEILPLVGKPALMKRQPGIFDKLGAGFKKVLSFGIEHEPTRAAVVGTIAGIATGVICMFVPHVLFWGEAQLQTLIDKGKTPLPIFGRDDEPTADLTAYGYCLIDPEDEIAIASGFGIGCSALITFTKILTIGLSLGTGIIGGQFWGPLFVGASASHLFTDLMVVFKNRFGFGEGLSTYPCVALLCIMGSAHVVTFRAHMAIMLILTLTISAFTPEEDTIGGFVSGDYSAVFPLLVVSCFISLMATRNVVFYKEQRCRGDIIASPEVLCEPGKEGQPMVVGYDEDEDDYSFDDDDWDDHTSVDDASDSSGGEDFSPLAEKTKTVETGLTSDDIEKMFMETQKADRGDTEKKRHVSEDSIDKETIKISRGLVRKNSSPRSSSRNLSPTSFSDEKPPASKDGLGEIGGSEPHLLPSQRLDELLAMPIDPSAENARRKARHRRIRSGSDIHSAATQQRNAQYGRTRSSSFDKDTPGRVSHRRSSSIDSRGMNGGMRERSSSKDSRTSRGGTPTQGVLMRVSSFGEVTDYQPSLMNQARKRASSVSRPGLPKSSGRHSRKNSESSMAFGGAALGSELAGALTQEDLEKSFSHMMNDRTFQTAMDGRVS